MARMKKDEVIAALKAIKGLEFDENGKYNELCKLLKANGTKAEKAVTVVSGKNSITIPEALYKRCREVIGMSDAMICSYGDADTLLQNANGMHPKSNVDARVKEGVRPEPMKFEDNMPDKFTLESILEAKFIKTNRDYFDRGNLQAFLRRINRRYGPFEPVRIVQDRSFKVVKRELVTRYTIYYKE